MPSPLPEFWFTLLLFAGALVAFNLGYNEGRTSVLKGVKDADKDDGKGAESPAVNKADDNNETW